MITNERKIYLNQEMSRTLIWMLWMKEEVV
jgi:hypothetical protein